MKKLFSVSFYLLFLLSSLKAQDAGRIYTKNEADNLYGPAISSVSVNSSDLLALLSKTNNFIMFSISGGKLVVLGDNRRVIYPTDEMVEANTVFRVFSVAILKDLLYKGQNKTTNIENRKDVLSLTNGNYTLEFGYPCPPACL